MAFDFSAASMFTGGFGVDTAGAFGAGPTFGAGAAGGALASVGTMGLSFALSAGPKLLDLALKNDEANRQREAQKDMLKMKFQQNRAAAIRKYESAYAQTDAYNKALVAGHNNKVEAYGVNLGLLEKEEAYAYQMTQLQASGEIAGFMEENLDLLTNYVQSSGSLAARGINSASAKLTELKNFTGGMLRARTRLQGNAAGKIGSILRSMDRIEMQSEAQKAAMYQQVKNKPTLRDYPKFPSIPRWKTPDSLKSKGLSFGQVAPMLLGEGISAAKDAKLFEGGSFG